MGQSTSQFDGQAVFITGAASGIGAELSRQLAAQGAKLLLADRNQTGLAQLVDELSRTAPDVKGVRCDVTSEDDVRAAVEATVSSWGRIDVAINNAGIGQDMKSFVDVTAADMSSMFSVNVMGVFFGMKYQLAEMLKNRSGSILNVSSCAGIGGAPKLAAYAASKHAVVGLTKTAAAEYAKYGIRVNAICPFFTMTPMVEDGDAGKIQDFLANSTPMKRLGTPAEIASAVLMLCAPTNSYLTGQCVAVDGGVSAL